MIFRSSIVYHLQLAFLVALYVFTIMPVIEVIQGLEKSQESMGEAMGCHILQFQFPLVNSGVVMFS
jgi:hypothetical protein